MRQVLKKSWALFHRETGRIYSGIHPGGNTDGPMFFFNPFHAQVYRDRRMPCPNAIDVYRVGVVHLIETDTMDKYDRADLEEVNTTVRRSWQSGGDDNTRVILEPIDAIKVGHYRDPISY